MEPLLFEKDMNYSRNWAYLGPASEEAAEWLRKKKLHDIFIVDPPRVLRNPKFFRKWWALVKVGFDYWTETIRRMEYNGEPVLPDFDRFRKDVTVLAGFYRPVVNLKGEVRLEPESLKWTSMTEERFTQLYDATIQVLLRKVFAGDKKWTEEEIRRVVIEIVGFV